MKKWRERERERERRTSFVEFFLSFLEKNPPNIIAKIFFLFWFWFQRSQEFRHEVRILLFGYARENI